MLALPYASDKSGRKNKFDRNSQAYTNVWEKSRMCHINKFTFLFAHAHFPHTFCLAIFFTLRECSLLAHAS
jgi:hypothetical protein